MTDQRKPSYEELESRCRKAESALVAIRAGKAPPDPEREREAHLKQVLLAIRNVNQLIVHETDVQRLIARACENLTETLGYFNAWIALLDGGRVTATAQSGFNDGFEPLRRRLDRGVYPECMRRTLESDATTVLLNPPEDCPDCPLSGVYSGRAGMAHRLAHEGRLFGILTVSVPAQFAYDAEAQELFAEVAGDLAFALAKREDDAALWDAQRRYQELFEGSRDGCVLVNPDGRITLANQAYCGMLGYSLEELQAFDSFFAFTPEKWHAWEREEIWNKRLLTRGHSGLFEKEYIRKDGTVFPVELQIYTVFAEDGSPQYIWGVVRDITERKQAEEALRASEARLSAAASNIPGAIYQYILRPGGGVEVPFISEGAETLFDRPVAELMDASQLFDDVHPDDLPRLHASIEESARNLTPWRHEFRILPPRGGMKWLRGISNPQRLDGGSICWHGLLLDITEEKQADDRLHDSEARFRILTEESAISIGLYDAEGKLTYANPATLKIFGVESLDALIGYDMFSDPFLTEDSKILLREGQPVHIEQKVDFNQYPKPLREKLQRVGSMVLDVMISPLDPSGEGGGYLVQMQDITERKISETALRKSEHRFRSFVENANDIVYCLTAFGKFTYVSPNWLEHMGEPASEAVGKSFDPYVHPEDLHICREFLNDVFTAEHTKRTAEYRVYRKDGTLRWHMSTGSVLRTEEGRVSSYVGIARDVTERKEAEEALRHQALLLNQIQDVVTVTDTQGIVTYANEACCRMLGRTRDQLIGASVTSFGEDAEQGATQDEIIRKTIEEGEWRTEVLNYREDGTPVILDCRTHVIRDDQGNPAALFGISTDITERKQAEDEVVRHRKLLMEAERLANVGAWEWDIERDEWWLSEGWQAIHGVDSSRLRSKELVPIAHPDELPAVEQALNALRTGSPCLSLEMRIVRPTDGAVRHVACAAETSFDAQGKALRVTGAALDITERKQAEEALRESQERFRMLWENAPIATFEEDFTAVGTWLESLRAKGVEDLRAYLSEHHAALAYAVSLVQITDVNDQTVHMFEAGSKDHVIGSLAKSFSDEGFSAFAEELAAIWEGKEAFDIEFVGRTFKGRRIEYLLRWSTPVRGATPDLSRVIVAVLDITAHKQAEAERERLLFAIEQASEIIVITDVDANIQYANPAFESVTGYTRKEALGKNPRILKSGQHDAAFYEDLWASLTRGETWQGRFINKRKDGTLYTEEAAISPVRDASGKVVNYVAVKRDITRELALEQQYRQAQKMEAIGQLTGGVAHDFNNLLQVISGGADLALEDLEENHPARDSVLEIEKASKRAATLVSQLLLFSRRQIMRPEALDLNEIVDDLLKMLRRVIGEHIALDWAPGARKAQVYADRGMIEQALMNLCVNARDAMPTGGVLTIETQPREFDEAFCKEYEWASPGRYVMLSVTDTGCGIADEHMSRIFEPFFTTKETGKGTGLGLATVYGIVRQHRGMINAYSEVGKGTTFKVYLPISNDQIQSQEEAEQAPPPEGGAETILLAEDDPAVSALAQRILDRAGYTVFVANNGLEAVKLFKERCADINAVLLDVVMPEMGGREAYEHIRELRPDVPVLFTSGYSENAIHTGFVLDEGLELIQKPYNGRTLLQAIRTLLDRPLPRR